MSSEDGEWLWFADVAPDMKVDEWWVHRILNHGAHCRDLLSRYICSSARWWYRKVVGFFFFRKCAPEEMNKVSRSIRYADVHWGNSELHSAGPCRVELNNFSSRSSLRVQKPVSRIYDCAVTGVCSGVASRMTRIWASLRAPCALPMRIFFAGERGWLLKLWCASFPARRF